MTLKDRILALKAEKPYLWPRRIAQMLGCREDYAAKVLAARNDKSAPQKPVPVPAVSNPKAIGAGNRSQAGYTRLM